MDSRSTRSRHAAGLRGPPQRQAIIQVLEDSDRPLNVVEILSRMAGYRSGVPTVHRNLQKFADQGWVEAIIGTDHVTPFVRCHSQKHHHVVQCEQCVRMVEVEGRGLKKALPLGNPAPLDLPCQQGHSTTRAQGGRI